MNRASSTLTQVSGLFLAALICPPVLFLSTLLLQAGGTNALKQGPVTITGIYAVSLKPDGQVEIQYNGAPRTSFDLRKQPVNQFGKATYAYKALPPEFLKSWGLSPQQVALAEAKRKAQQELDRQPNMTVTYASDAEDALYATKPRPPEDPKISQPWASDHFWINDQNQIVRLQAQITQLETHQQAILRALKSTSAVIQQTPNYRDNTVQVTTEVTTELTPENRAVLARSHDLHQRIQALHNQIDALRKHQRSIENRFAQDYAVKRRAYDLKMEAWYKANAKALREFAAERNREIEAARKQSLNR